MGLRIKDYMRPGVHFAHKRLEARPEVRSMNALRRLRPVSEVNEIHISGANNLFRTARRR